MLCTLVGQRQGTGRRAYGLWRSNPSHPGIQFKRIHSTEPIFSAQVGLGWRALGTLEGDTVTWFWIGSHAEYDTIVSRF
jgi:hypothetical protein